MSLSYDGQSSPVNGWRQPRSITTRRLHTMSRAATLRLQFLLALGLAAPLAGLARGDDTKARAPKMSFIRDVAPILVENCIACHNPRKSESKYVMTTFAQLAKGGQQGEGTTLEPGKPDESDLVELIKPGGQPRMPY